MKKILLALCILLVIATGVYLYLRHNNLQEFEPELKAKLNSLVRQSSQDLYHLEMDKLETDIVNGRITLINAHLYADTVVYALLEKEQKAPNDLFDIFVKELTINDVDVASFLSNRKLELRKLLINNPTIIVKHKKQPYLLPEDSSRTIFQQIQKDLNNIRIDTIDVNDIDFQYTNVLKKSSQGIMNVNLRMRNLLIDSSTQFDRQRFLFAENCIISTKNYKIDTGDSLYRFSTGELNIETARKVIHLKNIRFEPRLSAEAFYKTVKHQQDRFTLSIGDAEVTDVNWWTLLAQEEFFARKIQLKNGRIQVSNDRSLPPDTRSKIGKYPHQLLMKVPFVLKLDSIDIDNFDINYTEYNPKTERNGTINFENVYGTVRNVTNVKTEIAKNGVCRISASGKFLKEAPISANFQLNLAQAEKGLFTVTATLGAIKGESLNAITRPLGMVEIKSGQVNGVNLTVTGDNNQGHGTVKLLYNDLAITALKKDEEELKKRGLLSFIANNFVIKKENPKKGEAPRVEKGVFQRDPTKSFFNLIWKATFVAAGKTVGFEAK